MAWFSLAGGTSKYEKLVLNPLVLALGFSVLIWTLVFVLAFVVKTRQTGLLVPFISPQIKMNV